MTKVHFTHYMLGGANDRDRAADNGVDHFRLGLAVRHRVGLRLRPLRPVRQGADGGRLDAHRGRHRPAGGRRGRDGRRSPPDAGRAGSARPLQHARTVVAYGLVPIAGAQLFYYNAVAHLSVGVALLLEYTAPILVVGWLWATTRRTAHAT